MKSFSDEDLIAYHLHELPPRRARALERALQTDPALAAEFEAYRATLQEFKKDDPLPIDEAMLDRQWSLLRTALTAHSATSAHRPWWLFPSLAAAGLAFASTLWLLDTPRHPQRGAPALSSIRQPQAPPQTLSPTQNPSPAFLPPIAQRSRPGGQGTRPSPFTSPLTSAPHSSSSGVSYLALATTPNVVPHLIPLTPAAPPVFPSVPSVPIRVEAEKQSESAPEGWSRAKRNRLSVHHEHTTDITLAMAGTLIGTRAAGSLGTEQRFQGATRAVSAVGAFHQQLRPLLGYRLTVSYTRPEFQFTNQLPSTDRSTSMVNSRIYELAATYVIQGPHRGRVSTAADAGIGFMRFLPTIASTDTTSNLRVAGVVGVAAEIAITRHLAAHLGYRGQLFKGPDFSYVPFGQPVATTTLLSNEPTVGITYRFSHK